MLVQTLADNLNATIFLSALMLCFCIMVHALAVWKK